MPAIAGGTAKIAAHAASCRVITLYAARHGMPAAVEKFRQIRPAPVGLWPMHTVQIDYTWIDAYVLDSKCGPIRGTWESRDHGSLRESAP